MILTTGGHGNCVNVVGRPTFWAQSEAEMKEVLRRVPKESEKRTLMVGFCTLTKNILSEYGCWVLLSAQHKK